MLDILQKKVSLKPKLNRTFQYSLFILYSTAIGIFFLGDIFRKVAIYFDYEFTRYSTVSKIIVLVFFLIFFATNLKTYLKSKNAKTVLVGIIILTCAFIMGQISLNNDVPQPLNFFLNIEYLAKYLYFPITILLFSSLKLKIEYIKKIILLFELIFLINSLFILIGFCFELNIFSTYGAGRFGYIGIFSRSGQTSFFVIMFILFYYGLFINEQTKTKTNTFKLVFLIAVSVLVGTKRIYLFLILLALHYFFIEKAYKRRTSYKYLAITILIGVFFKQNLIEAFNKFFSLFKRIYYEDGFISSFTSYRSDLFYNTLNEFVLKNWSFTNYIFGGPSFQDYVFITGMDFFDLYLFFGLIGIFVYYKLFNLLIDFRIQGNFILFYFLILAITSFFSSAFLYDPFVNLLFFIMMCQYSCQEKSLERATM
jgi:hypothetical protein